MVKSMGSLVVGIICLIVAIAIAIYDHKIGAGTIASAVIAIVCIFNALRS